MNRKKESTNVTKIIPSEIVRKSKEKLRSSRTTSFLCLVLHVECINEIATSGLVGLLARWGNQGNEYISISGGKLRRV